MLAKIKQLENIARILEPDEKQRQLLSKHVDQYIKIFLDELNTSSTYHPDNHSKSLYKLLSIQNKPASIETLIKLIQNDIVQPGLNVTSPGFLGYIPGGGLYSAALGDYIAAVTNRFAGAFFVSPGAARLETILVQWMCHLLGYPKGAGGNLSSGGSLANFIGIVTARQSCGLKSHQFNRCVVYTSSQVHHSIIKALRIAGLDDAIIRFVPVDDDFRLIPAVLEQMIKQDAKHQLIPWLIVATAGTTNTGAVDPMDDIAAIAKKNHVWLHVDAAYGGFFILSRSVKNLLRPISQADSITIDPHKGLFIPYGLGVILTKQENTLFKTHYYDDDIDYLPSLGQEFQELSAANLSPELSKHFRGLRLWLPLKLYGIAPFRAALDEKLLLARYFYQEISKNKCIEIACKPQLSIVTFRYCPKVGNANQFNKLLAEKIKIRGKIFFSTTYLHHHLYLRMACLNFRTHLSTIKLALEVLESTIKDLLKK